MYTLEELVEAPTPDLAEQLIQETTQMFKAANCSANMKDSLVGKLRRSAATCRAVTNILVIRARKKEGATKPFVFGEGEEKLREENKGLRREIEELQKRLESKTPHFPPSMARNRRAKRARWSRIDSSDEEGTSASLISMARGPRGGGRTC